MEAKTGVNKINRVCKAIMELTGEDFKEMREIAEDQANYTNPLRMASAKKVNDMGNHNLNVLAALENVREIIKNFEKIKG